MAASDDFAQVGRVGAAHVQQMPERVIDATASPPSGHVGEALISDSGSVLKPETQICSCHETAEGHVVKTIFDLRA